MKLTRKRAIELYRQMWRWCGKTGKDKRDWPGLKKYGYVSANCFLCHYCEQELLKCCIIKWPGGRCSGGLYGKWFKEKNIEKRKALARKIAELPEAK